MKLSATDLVILGENYYFFSNDVNLIFQMKKKDNKVSIFGKIPGEQHFVSQLCRRILVYDPFLVFIPYNMKNIWLYNVRDNHWDYICINTEVTEWAFFEAIIEGDFLFLFAGKTRELVRINLLDRKIDYFENVLAALYTDFSKYNDVVFRGGYVKKGEDYYLASSLSNHVLRINLNNMDYSWEQVGSDKNSYSGIAYIDGKFWLSPRNNTPIVIWDGSGDVNYIDLPDEGFLDGFHSFSGVYTSGANVYFPCMDIGKSLIIDSKTGKINVVDNYYYFGKSIGTNLYMLDSFGRLERYENGEVVEITKCIFKDDDYRQYLNSEKIMIPSENGIIRENEYKSLDAFIAMMTI